MFISKKELLKRIKSLEEALGVVYHKEDTKDDYAQHVINDYGFMKRAERLLGKDLVEKVKED